MGFCLKNLLKIFLFLNTNTFSSWFHITPHKIFFQTEFLLVGYFRNNSFILFSLCASKQIKKKIMKEWVNFPFSSEINLEKDFFFSNILKNSFHMQKLKKNKTFQIFKPFLEDFISFTKIFKKEVFLGKQNFLLLIRIQTSLEKNLPWVFCFEEFGKKPLLFFFKNFSFLRNPNFFKNGKFFYKTKKNFKESCLRRLKISRRKCNEKNKKKKLFIFLIQKNFFKSVFFQSLKIKFLKAKRNKKKKILNPFNSIKDLINIFLFNVNGSFIKNLVFFPFEKFKKTTKGLNPNFFCLIFNPKALSNIEFHKKKSKFRWKKILFFIGYLFFKKLKTLNINLI